MAEDKLKELNDRVDKVVSDIYNYIKCVDEKVVQSDKTVKFISSQQSEQMKELIAAKTDNLRRFFEEAIRLQTEVVRNTYETMISELKLTYMEDLKNKDAEYYKLYNQKEETLKASFEADCQKRLNECYAAAKADFDKVLTETVSKYEAEKIALQEKFSTERQTDKQSFEVERQSFETERQSFATERQSFETERQSFDAERQALLAERQKVADEVYQNTKTEYEDRIKEIVAWHEKNLQTKLEEAQAQYNKDKSLTVEYYENEKRQTAEAFENDRKQIAEAFENDKKQIAEYYEGEKQKTVDFYENEIKTHSDNAYEVGQNDTTERYNEIIKNLEQTHKEELQQQKEFYEAEMARRSEEAYNNGKAETEAWHDDIVRKKLEIQAQYFDGEIEKAKADAYAAGESHMKKEMYDEMDEAARRNEAELKLFLDFYEAKMKPFKRFINIHETADKRIKDIQRRITNKINKTILHKPTIPPPADEFPKDIERTVQQATFDAPLSEDGDK